MRRMTMIVPTLGLAVAACAGAGKTTDSGDVLSLAPIASETLAADYLRLAECAYGRLDQTGLRKADFPASRTIKLTLDSGSVRYWEIVFTSRGPNRTSVDLSAVRTMWGPETRRAGELMPIVRACASV